MQNVNAVYGNLIADVLRHGSHTEARNGGTKRLFARQETFDRNPLVSARTTFWRGALREFEWFLSGSSNIKDLHESCHPWWKPWANKDGEVPFNYSHQFRRFHGTPGVTWRETKKIPHNGGTLEVPVGHEVTPKFADQIVYLQEGIKSNPTSRRLVATTWNAADMLDPACPITNCHGTVIQLFCEPDGKLHLVMYQRSVDSIAGLPHNWVQYWAFLMFLARHGSRQVGTFTWIGGDVHIYDAHSELAWKIAGLGASVPPPPDLIYKPSTEQFKADDFSLAGEYRPLITEKAALIV